MTLTKAVARFVVRLFPFKVTAVTFAAHGLRKDRFRRVCVNGSGRLRIRGVSAHISSRLLTDLIRNYLEGAIVTPSVVP